MSFDQRLAGPKITDEMFEANRPILTAIFKKHTENFEKLHRKTHASNELAFQFVRNLAGEDPKLKSAVEKAKKLSAKERSPLKMPKRKPVQARARVGSVSITYAPPFYPWTWDSTGGDGEVSPLTANGADGNVSLGGYTSPHGNSGNYSARGAMGAAFTPPFENGIMDVSANPSYSYDLGTGEVLDSASVGGFIGLVVTEYTQGLEFVQAPIDQQINIAGGGGQSTGFPLSASTPIDSDHIYFLWVWIGTSGAGPGWSAFWGADAYSNVSIGVGSISMHAYG
jgi:hypothetical protein